MRAALLFLAISAAFGQAVEGTLINTLTAAGVGGARVTLIPQAGPPASSLNTTTDAAGHYHFEEVQAGRYIVAFEADGYDLGSMPAVTVGAEGPPVRVDGHLMPFSHITGRVVDGRGTPVAKAKVDVADAGGMFAVEADEKGNFALNSLFPTDSGTLSAAAPPGWKPPEPDPETGQPRRWAYTYYPGTIAREMAAPIVLHSGVNLEGIEIRLVAAPVHPVRGVLLNPEGVPVAKVPISLDSGGPNHPPPDNAQTGADGSFEFRSVVDGRWRVSAELSRAGQDTLRAAEWVDVSGRAVDGVKVRLVPPFAVRGRVILETAPGIQASRFPAVGLTQMEAGRPIRTYAPVAPAAEDGRFRIDNVYPGTFVVDFNAPPRQYYLEGIWMGEQPANGEVEFSASSPEITLLYKTNGGTLRGTVENCGSGEIRMSTREQPRVVNSVPCGPHGHFEFHSLRPGDYYVQAIERTLLPPPVTPAFFDQATRVTIRAGEITEVNLQISTVR